eukprot:1468104-Pyramimonas_sp.AAC.2
MAMARGHGCLRVEDDDHYGGQHMGCASSCQIEKGEWEESKFNCFLSLVACRRTLEEDSSDAWLVDTSWLEGVDRFAPGGPNA